MFSGLQRNIRFPYQGFQRLAEMLEASRFRLVRPSLFNNKIKIKLNKWKMGEGWGINMHNSHVYIYIYIYMCVCNETPGNSL